MTKARWDKGQDGSWVGIWRDPKPDGHSYHFVLSAVDVAALVAAVLAEDTPIAHEAEAAMDAG